MVFTLACRCGEVALIVRMPDDRLLLNLPEAPELRKLTLEALLEPNSSEKLAKTQWIYAQAATLLIAPGAEFEAPILII
jgi:hypothetical protein